LIIEPVKSLMMQNNLIRISDKHENAAATILERIEPEIESNKKYVLGISGEVGSGKATVAFALARILKKKGIIARILYLDNYYIIPPGERKAWRMKYGIENIGPKELDWHKINANIQDFLNGRKAVMPCVDLISGMTDTLETHFEEVEVLILAGLYSIMAEPLHLKVFIELTYKETLEVQKALGKEEMDEFRLSILEKEHEEVMNLKPTADFYIDFDTSMEIFHL